MSDDPVDMVEYLKRRNAALTRALAEASQWNWMDEDAEESIPEWVVDEVDRARDRVEWGVAGPLYFVGENAAVKPDEPETNKCT